MYGMTSAPTEARSAGAAPRQATGTAVVPSPTAALTQLERVLEAFRIANARNKDAVGDARLQQLEWVAGELGLALALGLTEDAGDSLSELLAPKAIDVYLSHARAGLLRQVGTVGPAGSTDASMRVRVVCLEMFASYARIPFRRPAIPADPGRTPAAPPNAMRAVSDYLNRQAEQWGGPPPEFITRGLAMWAVMCETAPRLGEMETMRVEHLADDLSTLTVIRQPQGGLRGKEPERETLPLSPHAQGLMAQWLEHRAQLVHQLEGTNNRLWVSVVGNHTAKPDDPPSTRIAGLPFLRRGISRWYKKIVDAVQIEQDAAGVPAENLAPTRWETMRRRILLEAQQQGNVTPLPARTAQ